MKRWQWVVVLLMALAVAASLVYLWQSPRLVSFTPSDGATIQANRELRLVFSRTMQTDSVQSRLIITPAQAGSFQWQGSTLIFTPTKLWPAGQEIHIQLARGARGAGLLGFTTYREASWSFWVGQPRLVYLYPASGPANLYTLALPVGTGQPGKPQRLTNLTTGIQDFWVTADDKEIYYSVKTDQSSSAIYRLDLTAQPSPPPTLILECPQALCRAVAVSYQGDYLAYERTAYQAGNQLTYPQVWLASLPSQFNPGANAVITPALQPVLAGDALHQTMQPDWSSLGRLVYYDSTQAAFVVLDPHSSESWQFSNQTGQSGSWNPDGNDYVAPEIFISESGNPNIAPDANSFGNSHLIRFKLADHSTQDLTQAEDLEDTAPAYSPDGAYLVFARKYLDLKRWTPGRQLWLMQADGQGARPLTSDPDFNYYDFAWSPTGDWIACVRFNQTIPMDPLELWAVDSLTGRGLRLVVGGYAPQWLP